MMSCENSGTPISLDETFTCQAILVIWAHKTGIKLIDIDRYLTGSFSGSFIQAWYLSNYSFSKTRYSNIYKLSIQIPVKVSTLITIKEGEVA